MLTILGYLNLHGTGHISFGNAVIDKEGQYAQDYETLYHHLPEYSIGKDSVTVGGGRLEKLNLFFTEEFDKLVAPITHWITNRILSVIALRIADSIYQGDCDQVTELRKQTLNSSLFDHVKLVSGEEQEITAESRRMTLGHPCRTSQLPLLKYTRQLVAVAYKNRFPVGNWTVPKDSGSA